MKITYLGQAGWLLETNGISIMVDPYLSDSCGQRFGPASARRQPIDERFLAMKPDVLVITHNHLDHYDPDTVNVLLSGDASTTVLCPSSVWGEVRKTGGKHNYVWFNRHTRWSQAGVTFTAVKAEHSDPAAIGVLIDDGDGVYYITGDTLYNADIFADLPSNLRAVFVPVNGVGNNMNAADAMAFAQATGATYAVPCHVGMLDDRNADAFTLKNRVVPTIYQELLLK